MILKKEIKSLVILSLSSGLSVSRLEKMWIDLFDKYTTEKCKEQRMICGNGMLKSVYYTGTKWLKHVIDEHVFKATLATEKRYCIKVSFGNGYYKPLGSGRDLSFHDTTLDKNNAKKYESKEQAQIACDNLKYHYSIKGTVEEVGIL